MTEREKWDEFWDDYEGLAPQDMSAILEEATGESLADKLDLLDDNTSYLSIITNRE